jgi:predicted nucleic acid-binding protein
METKHLIFDSSTVINLSMNGLTDLLIKLKKNFNGKFIITDAVKYEIIDRPLQIKKFELAAISIRKLIEDGVFDLSSSMPCPSNEIKDETARILNYANNAFLANGEPIHIIDKGEASCIALALLCTKNGIKSAIAVDERTTRVIGEKPNNLKYLLEYKLHTKVEMKKDFDFMKDINFIRSSELAYVAWKKGLVELKDKNLLDALLYATKFKGCAISRQEIEEIKKIR